ncbi:hypothetical protein Tco_0303301 [Tanacetum coccineum]
MASIGSSPFWNTSTIRPESEVFMIDELSIVETNKVIHIVETDKVKQIVDVESSGKSADEINKETVSIGEMQLKQEDRSCVHASINQTFIACRSLLVPMSII